MNKEAVSEMSTRNLLCIYMVAMAAVGGESQPESRNLRFAEVLQKATARARTEDARMEMANGNIKLLEALGKWRVELRPSMGIFAFSNPMLLATNLGSSLLLNRRTAPTANTLQAARFDALAAEVQAESLRVRTRIEAAHHYFDLLAKQQMADRAAELLVSRRKGRKQVDAMMRNARISALEKLTFEQDLLDLESQWLDAETARKGAAIRLSQLIGLENPAEGIRVEDVSIAEGTEALPLRNVSGQFFQKALMNRAEIKLLQNKIAALSRQGSGEKKVKLDTGGMGFARVSNSPGLVSEGAKGTLLGGNTGRGDLGLTISLRDTGEKRAQEQLHAARIKVLEMELRKLEDSIRAEVATLENEVSGSSERLALASRRLELARQADLVVQARVEGGLADPSARAYSEQRVLAAHWMEARATNERKASLFTLLTMSGLDPQSPGTASSEIAIGGQD